MKKLSFVSLILFLFIMLVGTVYADWAEVERWNGNIKTPSWGQVEKWNGNLISKSLEWQLVEIWKSNIYASLVYWFYVELWSGDFIASTLAWNECEIWDGSIISQIISLGLVEIWIGIINPPSAFQLPLILITGLGGIFLMVFAPVYAILAIRKNPFHEDTMERIGICLILFAIGFGLVITWLWS